MFKGHAELHRVTVGVGNGPICHGAGRRHKTINDMVVAIEYVSFSSLIDVLSYLGIDSLDTTRYSSVCIDVETILVWVCLRGPISLTMPLLAWSIAYEIVGINYLGPP